MEFRERPERSVEEERPLEILVVEDDLFNQAAAKIYFQDKEGVEIDIAGNYDDAMKKLDETIYAGAIIDLNIPRAEGKRTEKLGYEVGKKAEELKLPYVIFTGGTGHHGTPIVHIYPMGQKALGTYAPYPGKAEPEAWDHAYEALRQLAPNMEEILAAKKRYLKFTGKIYKPE
ncbi:MAG: response regulator [Nanoarchaeota archaeon]|nr:response regulator [Nanoarchaeota archaeon]